MGINDELTEFELDQIRKSIFELGEYNEVFINTAYDYLSAIFEQWQLKHGTKPSFLGLLGGSSTSNINLKLSVEDLKKYQPWQCAGWGVNNPIQLAIKLWIENYEPFKDCEEKIGIHDILAVLIFKTSNPAHSSSIFRAYRIIVDYKVLRLRTMLKSMYERNQSVKLKKSEQLKEAQLKSIEVKKARSEEYVRLWNVWANETKKANPYWLRKQVVDHVYDISKGQNHKMTNGKQYQQSTIDKKIVLKKLALQSA